MAEYGLFSDEGCVEAGFCSMESAQEAIWERYDEEDGLEPKEICPDHEQQPAEYCEDCWSQDEDDE